jgi:hypothetical protein
LQLLCECDDKDCRETIDLTMDEVIFLRGPERNRYILIPGHESPDDVIVGMDSLNRLIVVENSE